MEERNFNKKLGLVVTDLRENNEVTKQQLSDNIGLSRQIIYNIELGKYNTKAYHVYLICDYFGITLEEFYKLYQQK